MDDFMETKGNYLFHKNRKKFLVSTLQYHENTMSQDKIKEAIVSVVFTFRPLL